MMRSKRSESRCGGFTLVEVLVVVAIIGILMGLVAGGLTMARKKAERVKVMTQVTDIASAWEAYRLEYGHFPSQILTEMGPDALGILRGDKSDDNPQGSAFLDFRSGATEYTDRWRRRFQFVLDTDYDGRVTVPGHGTKRVAVAVWSMGDDELDVDDDICSWEK